MAQLHPPPLRNGGWFAAGKENPRFAGGRHTTAKGYVRLKTRAGRGKYEHRFVMEEMLKAPIGMMFAGDGEIPAGMHTHHNDGNRRHNCQGNLMLLQECIHNAISRSHKAYLLAHYDEYLEMVARENEPDWVREGLSRAAISAEKTGMVIQYADGACKMRVDLIAAWNRGELKMAMSTSSGPKDYFKNMVCAVFDKHPEIERVVVVRGRGPTFLLLRTRDQRWRNVTGEQVIAA